MRAGYALHGCFSTSLRSVQFSLTRFGAAQPDVVLFFCRGEGEADGDICVSSLTFLTVRVFLSLGEIKRRPNSEQVTNQKG